MPKFIQLSDGRLTLGFASMVEAESFICAQSSNPSWRAQWTLSFYPNEVYKTNVLAVSTSSHVVLDFP